MSAVCIINEDSNAELEPIELVCEKNCAFPRFRKGKLEH